MGQGHRGVGAFVPMRTSELLRHPDVEGDNNDELQ